MTIDLLQVQQEMEVLSQIRKMIDKNPETAKAMLVDIIEKGQMTLNKFTDGK